MVGNTLVQGQKDIITAGMRIIHIETSMVLEIRLAVIIGCVLVLI